MARTPRSASGPGSPLLATLEWFVISAGGQAARSLSAPSRRSVAPSLRTMGNTPASPCSGKPMKI